MSTPDMGRIGIWSSEMRRGDKTRTSEIAAELDSLGFGALWIPGGLDGEVLPDVERLLAATERMTIATGILNLWKHEPGDVATWFTGLPDQHRARTMIGIGISHGPIIGEGWNKPVTRMREFLDALETTGMAMDQTCLAALGPKMIALSGERTAGAHPYITTPAHTAHAREILGSGPLLMPELKVVFSDDRAEIRRVAREGLGIYISLPNYRKSLMRQGYTEEDIDSLSDPLLDDLLGTGDAQTMKAKVDAHLAAGADHVCIQVLQGQPGQADPEYLSERYRELAAALL